MTHDVKLRNNVTDGGNGKQPMLFAHGFGCDQTMWRFIMPEFASDFRTIAFDYVGSGRSDRAAYDPERYATLSGYAQDLLEVCEALALSDVILVGHSVSSMIGALAARIEPERFSHLIMIGPSPCYLNDAQGYVGGFERADLEGLIDLMDRNYMGWASFLAPTVMKNEDRPELAAELKESFCSTDPMIARQFAEATFFSDNRNDLAGVTVPSLVLQCSDDSIAPDSVGEYVHANLSASVFRKLAATGHCPHLSHPVETVVAIREYLAEAAWPA